MTPHSIAAAFPPVDQRYLLQALSFSVHIPLVAFGLSFPAMVLFVEGLGRRRGDELYLTLARRWSKVMLTLFAVGVITGTVLSYSHRGKPREQTQGLRRVRLSHTQFRLRRVIHHPN